MFLCCIGCCCVWNNESVAWKHHDIKFINFFSTAPQNALENVSISIVSRAPDPFPYSMEYFESPEQQESLWGKGVLTDGGCTLTCSGAWGGLYLFAGRYYGPVYRRREKLHALLFGEEKGAWCGAVFTLHVPPIHAVTWSLMCILHNTK